MIKLSLVNDCKPVGGARGLVDGYSKASARRLKDTLNTAVGADFEFVTLTYHELVTDWKRAYADLRTLVKRIEREFPGVSIIWVREYQKRGAIHYHLLVWGSEKKAGARIVEQWHDIVSPLDDDHARYGGMVRNADAGAVAVSYMVKYASKSMTKGGDGRSWGKFGVKKAVAVVAFLTMSQASQLEAAMNGDGKSSVFAMGKVRSSKKYLGCVGSETRAIEYIRENVSGDIAYLQELC